MALSVQLFLKESRKPGQVVTTIPGFEKGTRSAPFGVRSAAGGRSHRAAGRRICSGTPEPFFEACGTVWNTFATHGRCPGCSHQWRWTTCLRCQEPSLHVDWYEGRRTRLSDAPGRTCQPDSAASAAWRWRWRGTPTGIRSTLESTAALSAGRRRRTRSAERSARPSS